MRAFDYLFSQKEAIEEASGSSLTWEPLEEKRASRFSASVDGGYRDEAGQWDDIQDELVTAMNRLEGALRPHLRHLEAHM